MSRFWEEKFCILGEIGDLGNWFLWLLNFLGMGGCTEVGLCK